MKLFQALSISAAICVTLAACAQEAAPEAAAVAAAQHPSLETQIEAVREQYDVPGLAVAIVNAEGATHLAGYGFRDVDAGLPMTPDTLINVGSVGKTFTGSLLAILDANGTIDLDAPVRTYLPDFALQDDYVSEHLTLRDAASHRSGQPGAVYLWNATGIDRATLIGRMRFVPYAGPFRDGFQYNNEMYAVIGETFQAADGRSWETLIEDEIFSPLGMTRSVIDTEFDPASDHDAATLYAHIPHLGGERHAIIRRATPVAVAPAGAVTTTAADLGRYLTALLNRQPDTDRRWLSDAAYEDLTAPAVAADLSLMREVMRDSGYAAYGLGWMISEYAGRTVYFHGGNFDGLTAAIAFMPSEDIGVAVLANMNTTLAPYDVIARVFDDALQLEPRDLHAELSAFRRTAETAAAAYDAVAAQRTDAPLSHALEAYAGDYLHPLAGRFDIRLEDDTLVMRYGDYRARLEHWGGDTFAALHEVGAFPFHTVRFLDGDNGRPYELEMFGQRGAVRQ